MAMSDEPDRRFDLPESRERLETWLLEYMLSRAGGVAE